MNQRGAAFRFCLAATIAGATAISASAASAAISDTVGKTTVQQRVVPGAASPFRYLGLGPGEPYTVRQDLAAAGAGRTGQRTSLVYFGQLSDFQLADEESPARVEVLDLAGVPLDGAWRPWEALQPQIDDAMVRQINQFTAASCRAPRRPEREP